VFLVDGPVLLAEALDAGIELETLYVEPDALDHPAVWDARDAGVRVRDVTRGALRKVLDLTTPQDMVAVAPQRPATFARLVSAARDTDRPLLVLVELSDPGNAGTLIRVAEAAGCVGVVLTERTVDLYGPKTVRATAGAIFRVPVAVEVPVQELLDACEAADVPTWSTVVDGGVQLEHAPIAGAGALLIGSEAHGLDAEVAARCTTALTIPMEGGVESLNAAVAGAVVMFDAARQRRAVAAGEPSGGATGAVGHNVTRPIGAPGAPRQET
jgi:TrmH family RNA methyltransferase